MEFGKYQASGNDFILIDNRDGKVEKFLKELNLSIEEFVKKICMPHIGVGADGVILIEPPENPENHFKWQFFNSDGSIAEMCGNGSRCAVRFAYEKGIIKDNNPEEIRFETLAGVIKAKITDKKNWIIKVQLTQPQNLRLNISIPVEEEKFMGDYINTGVPHVVIYWEDLENFDVVKYGRLIRFHPVFQPKGTNVNFIKRLSEDAIKIRTYERGVENETLACGTGSTAAAIIAYIKGYISKKPVKVHTKGGEILKIDFNIDKDSLRIEEVTLEGKAYKVFEGFLEKEIFL